MELTASKTAVLVIAIARDATGGLVEVSLTACNNWLFQSMMTSAVATAGISALIETVQTSRAPVFMVILLQLGDASGRCNSGCHTTAQPFIPGSRGPPCHAGASDRSVWRLRQFIRWQTPLLVGQTQRTLEHLATGVPAIQSALTTAGRLAARAGRARPACDLTAGPPRPSLACRRSRCDGSWPLRRRTRGSVFRARPGSIRRRRWHSPPKGRCCRCARGAHGGERRPGGQFGPKLADLASRLGGRLFGSLVEVVDLALQDIDLASGELHPREPARGKQRESEKNPKQVVHRDSVANGPAATLHRPDGPETGKSRMADARSAVPGAVNQCVAGPTSRLDVGPRRPDRQLARGAMRALLLFRAEGLRRDRSKLGMGPARWEVQDRALRDCGGRQTAGVVPTVG